MFTSLTRKFNWICSDVEQASKQVFMWLTATLVFGMYDILERMHTFANIHIRLYTHSHTHTLFYSFTLSLWMNQNKSTFKWFAIIVCRTSFEYAIEMRMHTLIHIQSDINIQSYILILKGGTDMVLDFISSASHQANFPGNSLLL